MPSSPERSANLRRRVVVYHANDCHLCERAIDVVRDAQSLVQFEVELVDITGSAALESEHRSFLPVIEIDGRRAFTYFVSLDALVDRLVGPVVDGDGSPPA